MPIDRAATLRNAEKLLRQGKLEQAIGEYLRVVQEQPRDWNTANTVGDLYVRVGQIDKAVEQFIRIADSLNDEGFLPKAAAVYKKILKLKPDHEHALLQAAEIAGSQGLYADARTYLNLVVEKRRSRGDKRGTAQARIILGGLDPADYAGRSDAARARVEMSDVAGAVRDFREMATELTEKGRTPEAVEFLREAAQLNPEDEEVRARLFEIHISADDFERAREWTATAAQFKVLAESLTRAGQQDEAVSALRDAVRLDPEDADVRGLLARAFVARGDMTSAAEYLTVEAAGGDPTMLFSTAEVFLRGGKVSEGLDVARSLVETDPSCREQIAMMGWKVSEHEPEAGFRVVELAADASVAQNDWPGAAAALQEFVTRVPNHVPALMRLVEICVDGGLEATMYSAQAQLADAYIAAGSATEARFISEDLVAREPWERSNIERFRKALALSGEADPDTVIAERLSGMTPFTSTDLNGGDFPPYDDTTSVPDDDNAPASEPGSTEESAASAAEPADPPQLEMASNDRSSNPIAPGSMADGSASGPRVGRSSGEPGGVGPQHSAYAKQNSVEVDLSIVLDDIKRPGGEQPPLIRSDNIDEVFGQLKDEASRKSEIEAAESEYRHGLTLQEVGDIEGALAAFKSASRAPTLRFVAASLIGRIYRDRGQMPHAIEWLERAAQAPPPNADDYHKLLYELAAGLEATGEVARALAICLELHSDAGAYRDVTTRIDRLSKVQTRG